MIVKGSEEGSRGEGIVRQEDEVHRHDQVYDNIELRDSTPQSSAQSLPSGLAESSSASSANRAVRIVESAPKMSSDPVGARRKYGHLAGERHCSEQGVPRGDSRATTSFPMSSNLSRDTERIITGSETAAGARRLPSASGGTIITSPRIPRTRDRGFSLRRTIFARHINEKAQATGSELELQPGLHFEEQQRPLHPGMEAQSDKKPRTSFAVVPVQEDPKQSKPTKKQNLTSFLPHYDTWVKDRAAQSNILTKLERACEKAVKFILRIHDIPPSKDGRHLQLDACRKQPLIDERTGRVYMGNTIRSSKYTVWNFLPRQLFAQFSKLANFYFLSVSILQMIPGLSTTGSFTTIVPLSFFVTLSMAKEGYDDFSRYRLDKAENNRIVSVLRADNPAASEIGAGPKTWVTKKWREVLVGDIVRLVRNEAAPADLVMLHAAGSNGIAYIETMALDGETNLKSKQALPMLAKACKTAEAIAHCKANFVVEDPNLDLYNFEGKCSVADETLPLTNDEVIYRGSILRNTTELYGMVIHSGEECKIRMNATKNPRIKAPALQAVVNKIVIIIVIFVLVLAIFNTIAYQIWYKTTERKAWYLEEARVAFFPILASFIILFNTMIPLSLYVSLEIVKLFQLVLMNDIHMYDEDSNTPMECRTSTINEELGQVKYVFIDPTWQYSIANDSVSYIFTDKTGTLTNNLMLFRRMSVAGTAWLHDQNVQEGASADEVKHANPRRCKSKGKKPILCRKSLSIRCQSRKVSGISFQEAGTINPLVGRKSSVSSRWRYQTRLNGAQPDLRTTEFLSYIQSKPNSLFARKARIFILAIALCHTCIPEADSHGEIIYQAASPDEQALVKAAQELGYMMIDRQNASITIKVTPPDNESDSSFETYQILNVIEFTSSRKRMSVIVRMPDDRICIFSKGADSTIAQLLRLSGLAIEKAIMVERRVSMRQSLEAQQALRRDSEQRSRKPRLSFNMNRLSIGGAPRPSFQSKRLQLIRDGFDEWLQDRETDVDSPMEDGQNAYSGRASAQVHTSPTELNHSNRSSFHGSETEDLVDEALVVDDAFVFEQCFQHINDFATEGLRTLLYGYRFLEEEEYRSWKKLYLDASTSLSNRQEMIERVGALIEMNLELAGATAIEDKLQDGVPEAIEKLRRAKIKLWMLTGDKRETAINIGHSCRLIKDYSSITILDHKNGDVEQRIAAAFVNINRNQVAHSVIVIDGATLGLIEANSTLRKLFIDLAIVVDSVICCRASPSQKAYLVSAIRKKVKNAVTLAIGDGANDIAMIQESHVGIGITGKEGLQAARTSDYSIAQFRFLLRLLLVHGRWNYVRTCKYTLGTFWKEMLFYLTQALYQRYAGYTGTSLYESWSLSMFNTLFTSLPVIFMGIFEKDLEATTLLAIPELYTFGHNNGGFNLLIYAFWMFIASSEAMIVFFIMLGLYGQAIFAIDNGLYAMGTLTYSVCVILIATKLQFLDLHNKSITCAIAMFLSVGGWCLWNLILSALYPANAIYNVQDGFLHRFGRNALWWLILILIVSICWGFEIAVKSCRIAFAPTDVDIFQELEKDKEIRKRLEAAAELGMSSAEDQEREEENEAEKKARGAEEARREKHIKELLERPREVMGTADGVAVQRKRLSDGCVGLAGGWQTTDSASNDMSKEEYIKAATVEIAADDDDNSDGGSAKKTKRRSGRSVDVHDLLRRGFGSVRRRSLDVGGKNTATTVIQHEMK